MKWNVVAAAQASCCHARRLAHKQPFQPTHLKEQCQRLCFTADQHLARTSHLHATHEQSERAQHLLLGL
jgi:hypothetical protein